MGKQYIIQIQSTDPYPFDNVETKNLEYLVRVNMLPLTSINHKRISHNIDTLHKMQSAFLINCCKVTEIRSQGFVVDYQYVPFALKDSDWLSQPTFIAQLKSKTYELFQSVCSLGILSFPTLQQFGLAQQGQPKIYLDLDFETTKYKQVDANLLLRYQRWNQKLFGLMTSLKDSEVMRSEHTLVSDHSQMINKKINELELRIIQIRKRRKSSQSSIPKVLSKEKLEHERKINMVLEYFPAKKNRNNSQDITHQLLDPASIERFHRSPVGESAVLAMREREGTREREREGRRRGRRRLIRLRR